MKLEQPPKNKSDETWLDQYNDPKMAMELYTKLLDQTISAEDFDIAYAKLTASPSELLYNPELLMEKRTEVFSDALTENLINLQKELPKTSLGKKIFKKVARTLFATTKIAVGAGIIGGVYTGIDLDKQEGFDYREQAAKELKEKGITDDQRYSAYKPGISEMLYEGITPLGYQTTRSEKESGFAEDFFDFLDEHGVPNTGMLQEFVPNLLIGRSDREKIFKDIRKNESLTDDEKQEVYHKKAWGTEKSLKRVFGHDEIPKLDDAWRLYLGLPQKENTFGISDFRPRNSKDDTYYYKINGFWEDFKTFLEHRDWYLDEDFQEFVDTLKSEAKTQEELEVAVDEWAMNDNERKIGEYIKKGLPFPEPGLKGYIEILNSQPGKKMVVETETRVGEKDEDIMYHYTVACGEDEKGCYIAYYDKWDLASFFTENILIKGVGKPFEIYDRLYYDPVTFEIIK